MKPPRRGAGTREARPLPRLPRLGRFHRWLHRWLRRLRRCLYHPRLDVVYSERYSLPRTTALTVPQDPLRGDRILTFLLREGLLRPRRVHTPRAASLRALRRVHTDDYLRSLQEAETFTRIVGTPMAEAEADALLRLQRYMVGGTNLAARRALLSGRVAVNLGGGLHHAAADRGQGFCIFNDIAVTIASLRHHGFAGRVLVVDLDLHHGDGTEAIFANDASVHTFSIHNQDWARPEAIEATRLELGTGIEDAAYQEALVRHLPPVVERFRPHFAFYLAGVDPAAGDRIGDWKITPEGMLERDRFVLEQLQGAVRTVPTVIVLAGGYGEEAWRYSARFLGTLLNRGRVLEPPSTDEITLMRYRTLARRMDPRQLTGVTDDTDWGLTEEDLYGLASPPRESRFLGYYSLHGIEMVLEAYGLLDRLRALGYRDFHLEWELNDPSGQTLRLTAGLNHRYLLMELRARRDRRTLPGLDLLGVEWLLLQNPKASFPAGRPPLPGQEHPGLGMLRDVVALLVVACERLHLDGISFVPAHYHLAVASAPLLRFLRPRDRVLFRALQELFKGLTVAEASRALDAGRVIRRDTGEPLQWPTPPMGLPVSQRMKETMATLEREDTETAPPPLEYRPPPAVATTTEASPRHPPTGTGSTPPSMPPAAR